MARLKLHFEVCIEKLEAHSDSLGKMTLLSLVSMAKRNTYFAEDCMGDFRNQTLSAAMKRMELIFAICAIRLDLRRNKALNKNLFAGWLVEGISELPQVMVHRWQYGTLVKRARNLRARWPTKPKKLRLVGAHLASLDAKKAAAVAAKERFALEKVLAVDLSKTKVGLGAMERTAMSGEFPSFELFRTGPTTFDFSLLSKRRGFGRPVCDVLCRTLQVLPDELNPFLNANVLDQLDECFWTGSSTGDAAPPPVIPIAMRRRCPNFKRDTKGESEGTFPDVKLSHDAVLDHLRMLLAAMQKAGFPRTAPRSRAAPGVAERRSGLPTATAAVLSQMARLHADVVPSTHPKLMAPCPRWLPVAERRTRRSEVGREATVAADNSK